jgi:serine/threonine-protein kinase HipA
MADTLVVLLDDPIAGTVTRLSGVRLRFDYDEAYRTNAGSTPLSVSMPTSVRSHPSGTIGPWLRGLLPDSDAVLGRWARDFHVSASPFSLLCTPVGHDCVARPRLHRPVQSRGCPGEDGSAQPERALGSSLGSRRDQSYPQARRRRLR